ncbi:MAG: hypothetical protein DCC58_17355 [Chloroflexi bacterium]|nr:MAG: hypothetical protein DCC58_17355 [Chloroflexota bacterium]
MVAWLLERGADASALDYRGNTPVQNALEAGRDDIAALLRAAG